jgi:hypothetical protein
MGGWEGPGSGLDVVTKRKVTAPAFLVAYLSYSSILKMEVVYSSEKSVNYPTTWRNLFFKHKLLTPWSVMVLTELFRVIFFYTGVFK